MSQQQVPLYRMINMIYLFTLLRTRIQGSHGGMVRIPGNCVSIVTYCFEAPPSAVCMDSPCLKEEHYFCLCI